MKKIFIVFILFLYCGAVFSETINLKPLDKAEILDYSYNQNDDILTIYKMRGTNRQVYFQNEETLWGGYQISQDKKSMIFWKDTFERNMPVFYLDGNRGELRFIGKIPINARMDKDGKYLIYEDVPNSGEFKIIDLKNGTVTITVTWKIQNKDRWITNGAGFEILRSTENEQYDYMILFTIENLVISKSFINIANKNLIIEFDDSDLPEVKLRKNEDYGSDFLGWY